jgi:hypothetical protein
MTDPEFRESERQRRNAKARRRYASGKTTDYKQKSIRTWLYYKTRNVFSNAKKRGLECVVNLDVLVGLWEKQQGRCAITGLPMNHCFDDPYSASVDRIDSSVGYLPGNIQLVCQAMNLAKNQFANDLIKRFVDDIRRVYEHRGNAENEEFTAGDVAAGCYSI